jgi:hypothetical protein
MYKSGEDMDYIVAPDPVSCPIATCTYNAKDDKFSFSLHVDW